MHFSIIVYVGTCENIRNSTCHQGTEDPIYGKEFQGSST